MINKNQKNLINLKFHLIYLNQKKMMIPMIKIYKNILVKSMYNFKLYRNLIKKKNHKLKS